VAAVTTAPSSPSPALAPPPGSPRFPLFDGFRGLLVLGILGFHVTEFTGRIGFGFAGRLAEVAGSEAVLGFFAISGFLLYRPFVASRLGVGPAPSVGRYLQRRGLRILPGYWVILTLLALYPGVTGAFSHDWWRYYGYLQLYSGRTEQQGIPVAWTLCVEVSFYLALPVWAAGMSRLRGGLRTELVGLALVFAAGVAVQLLTAGRLIGYQVGTSLPGQCAWIAIGMALAALSAAAQRDRRAPAVPAEVCWAVAAVAFGVLMATVPKGGLFGLITAVQTPASLAPTAYKIVLQAVLTVSLLAPLVFGDPSRGVLRRLLRWRPLVWLGVISYSFYLWHLTVVELLATGNNPGAFAATGWNLLAHLHAHLNLVLLGCALLLTGVLATVSYRLVELPFLRRKPPAI
jgi:peptidoglycan/LPS O-acetylase OafA/YrhL